MYALSDGRYILNTIYMYMLQYSIHVCTCYIVQYIGMHYQIVGIYILNTIYMYMYMC